MSTSSRRVTWWFLLFAITLYSAVDAVSQPRGASPKPSYQSTPPAETSPSPQARGTTQVETVKWTDVEILRWMKIGILVQAIISVLGFLILFFQITQLNRGIRGDAHSKLYDHYLKVTERLADAPHLRPYLYNCKILNLEAAGYADLREELDMMCEIILGLLEHATVQKENLPEDSWHACWEAYTNERLEKSVELRRFFRENYRWYAKSFQCVVKEKFPHLVHDCNCDTDTVITQNTCPAPGSSVPATNS